jgi:hypothetical protein
VHNLGSVWVTTCLSRGTELVEWPKDHEFIVVWSKFLKWITESWNNSDIDFSESFSDVSNKCRIYWLKGENTFLPRNPLEELCIFTGDLAQWSYLKRSLGLPRFNELERAAQQAHDRFNAKPGSVPSYKQQEVVRNVIDAWYNMFQRPRDRAHVVPTSSVSAALGLQRKSGGMRKWLRENYLALKDFNIIPTNLSEDANENRHLVLSNFLSILDKPMLEHRFCEDPNCTTPELHFPFGMQAIPESGERVRCATKPWVSLVYMTEPTQKRILRGMKRDPIAGPILRDKLSSFRKTKNTKFINSVDLKASTDNFTHHVKYHWAGIYDQLRSNRSERFLEAGYVLCSFGMSRVLSTEEVKHYPKLPTIREFAYGLYEKYRADPAYFEEVEGFNEFYFDGDKWSPISYEQKRGELQSMSFKGHKRRVEFYDYSARSIGEDVRLNLWKSIGGDEESYKQFSEHRPPHPALKTYITWRGKGGQMEEKKEAYLWLSLNDFIFANKNLVMNEYAKEYRRIFGLGGTLSKKGQHMSLPLSWPSLSALSTAAVYQCSPEYEKILSLVGRLHSEIDHSPFETPTILKRIPRHLKFPRVPEGFLLVGKTPHDKSNNENSFILEKGDLSEFKCHRCQLDTLADSLEGADRYEKTSHLIEYATGVTSITLGDDAVHASDFKDKIDSIRSFLESFNCVIHNVKDVISTTGRYVIGEYMVDQDSFVERLRPIMISQADRDPKYRWKNLSSFKSSPIYYWLPSEKKDLVDRLEMIYHHEAIRKGESLNVPLYVPRDLGGMGLPGPISQQQASVLYKLLDLSADEFYKKFSQLQESIRQRPNNIAWRLTMEEMGVSCDFGEDGLTRKQLSDLVQERLPKWQFQSDSLLEEDTPIDGHNHLIWSDFSGKMPPLIADYIVAMVRQRNQSLTFHTRS